MKMSICCPFFGCWCGTQQIGYLEGPILSGPTAFWDFYSPHLGELGSLTSSLVLEALQDSWEEISLPPICIHTFTRMQSHIIVFCLEVFEGLVTPDWKIFLEGISGLFIGGCVMRRLEFLQLHYNYLGSIFVYSPLYSLWISQNLPRWGYNVFLVPALMRPNQLRGLCSQFHQ